MTQPTRMDAARRRVRIARYVIAAAAAGAFAGAGLVARAAHPGTHGSSTSAQAAIPAEPSLFQQAAAQSTFGSGGGSVSSAPASSPPVVQSSGS
jgi:hypothetical protein